jgi:hypothetical protein
VVNQSDSGVAMLLWTVGQTTYRGNTSLLAGKDVWVSINDWVASHPVGIIGVSIVHVVAAGVRIAPMPKAGTIVIECMIGEDTVALVVVVALHVAIDYRDVPSRNVVSIVDIAAMDNMATGVSISIEPYAAAIVVEGIVGWVCVVSIRIQNCRTLGSMGDRVAIHNRKVVDKISIILKPA